MLSQPCHPTKKSTMIGPPAGVPNAKGQYGTFLITYTVVEGLSGSKAPVGTRGFGQ